MMFILELMEQKNMTRADLSRLSMVPESTLRDILNGTSRIEHCEALTLALIAEALDTTVEEIIEHSLDEDEEDAFDEAFEDEDVDEYDNEESETPIELPNQSAASFYSMLNRVREECRGNEAIFDLCRFTRDDRWADRFFEIRAYSTVLFIVGLADYICRKKKMKPFPEYEKYRRMRLKNPVYPLSLYDPNMTAREYECEKALIQAYAIPELARFNILMTEKDIVKRE